MTTNAEKTRRGMLAHFLASRHEKSKKYWARRAAMAPTLDDLWLLMRKRVPPVVAEYFRGGAEDEESLFENVLAFRETRTTVLGARKFVDQGLENGVDDGLDLSVDVFGTKVPLPWFVCPVGNLRNLWPEADAVVSDVAGEFGIPMTLSTLSGTPMELVCPKERKGLKWFQLYLCGGREAGERGIARAKALGFNALVLTIDTAVAGNRAAHARMRPTDAIKTPGDYDSFLEYLLGKARLAPQMATRLSWLSSFYHDGGVHDFYNIWIDDKQTPMPFTPDIGKQLASSAVTWEDIKWIKEAWGDELPLIIKGVHHPDDVRKAYDIGAKAVVWSNHGGRQQDRVLPTLHMVQKYVPTLRGELDILHFMDGGIRRGADLPIAYASGVDFVGIGRVIAAGVGSAGHAGMRRAFEILKKETCDSMRRLGVQSIAECRQLGPKLFEESRILSRPDREIVF